MSDVQAVILAGGKGTRLRPVTAGLPKPLVPVANRPLILHQLRHLAAHGVRDVALALGYAADRFADIADRGAELGLNVRVITEPAPLGTGGALRWCADAGAFEPDRPLLWLNGDVVASPDIGALERFHLSHGALVTFWLTSQRDVTQFGVLELDGEGFVERFVEKPGPEETTSHLVNAGVLMLAPRVLRRIPPDTFFSFEQQLLPLMVREREPIFGRFDGGYWLDTGNPRAYLAANRHVLEGRVDWEPAGSVASPGLWVGEGVEVRERSIIKPAAIGSGSVVEDGAQLFGRTVLGDGVRVRSGARLENCVLFDGVEVGHDVDVYGSVVCAEGRIGDACTLDRSIVGARTSVGSGNELRGTRLWNDVELGSGVLVVDELPRG
ncbi:MAG: sugar phosphate nucleotidyltransferase [Actinomycetota bacterium]